MAAVGAFNGGCIAEAMQAAIAIQCLTRLSHGMANAGDVPKSENRCDGLLLQAWERSRPLPQMCKHPGLVSWRAALASGGCRTM